MSKDPPRESGGVMVVGPGDIREGGRGGSCAEAARCVSDARGDDDCTMRLSCSNGPCTSSHGLAPERVMHSSSSAHQNDGPCFELDAFRYTTTILVPETDKGRGDALAATTRTAASMPECPVLVTAKIDAES